MCQCIRSLPLQADEDFGPFVLKEGPVTSLVFINSSNRLNPLGGELDFRCFKTTTTFHVNEALGSAGLEAKTPFMNFCSRTEDPNSEESVQVDTKVTTAERAELTEL